ncbi:MAG TPA: hypothetical protein VJR87_01095 [Allosphingosinicella sp.]|nr:hypothetical protein [Allosphingosinicella sp.]
MTKLSICFTAAASAALFALGACDGKPTIIHADGPADVQADALAKAKPVALPPSIAASRIYRCKDNSLLYIDFMSDQKSANFRTKKGDDPVVLTAPEAGQPFTAAGYSVAGSGSQITVTSPGKGSQSCKA